MSKDHQIIVFEKKNIRQIEHEGEIYFSVIDIIEVLTDSPSPSHYWSMLKKRESQLVTICYKLKMLAADGKQRPTDCANTEGVFRIIQSVPSPKAEPFKMWLAGLGKQALVETNDPELGFDRLTELYKAQGRTEEWIEKRLQSIKTRKELTDEWQKRGIKEGQEYSILTATIAKGTFGLTPSEHSEVKNLKKENLRDHMTSLELIFTALSEEVTRTFAIKDDAQGFNENLDVAYKGGDTIGKYRRDLEEKIGEPIVSAKNFLPKNEAEELPEKTD